MAGTNNEVRRSSALESKSLAALPLVLLILTVVFTFWTSSAASLGKPQTIGPNAASPDVADKNTTDKAPGATIEGACRKPAAAELPGNAPAPAYPYLAEYPDRALWAIACVLFVVGLFMLIFQSVLFVSDYQPEQPPLQAPGDAPPKATQIHWKRGLALLVVYLILGLLVFVVAKDPPLAPAGVGDMIARCVGPSSPSFFHFMNPLGVVGVLAAATSSSIIILYTAAGSGPHIERAVLTRNASRLNSVLMLAGFVQTCGVFEVATLYKLTEGASRIPAVSHLTEGITLSVAFSSSLILLICYVPAAWILRQRGLLIAADKETGDLTKQVAFRRVQQVLAITAPVLSTVPILKSLSLLLAP